MTTNPTSTTYDSRTITVTVTVTVTVTKTDGAPAPTIPIAVQEVVLFTTWNPWGDPIDPT
ncbi:hypothetical protein ACWD7F_16400 [Streptomyces sp. NPDC005122]